MAIEEIVVEAKSRGINTGSKTARSKGDSKGRYE